MILSILICTVENRRARFDTLYKFLLAQGDFKDKKDGAEDQELGVEILYHRDNKEISVGAKRQLLVERAQGHFVVFIDDDDQVPDYYIAEIRKAIVENVNLDSIGFMIECNMEGKHVMADMSNKYADWNDNENGFRYVRTPYQKTPTRRELVIKIGYKDLRYGEDYEYSQRLKLSGLIKKEHYIDKVMYFYIYKTEAHNQKYGIK